MVKKQTKLGFFDKLEEKAGLIKKNILSLLFKGHGINLYRYVPLNHLLNQVFLSQRDTVFNYRITEW